MVKHDRSMKLPLRMKECDGDNDGSIDLVDKDNLYIAMVYAEEIESERTFENLLDTRKDAVFIVNAVNSFDTMLKLVKNYEKILKKEKPNSKDLGLINKLFNSFKTIDYENGIPYNWDNVN